MKEEDAIELLFNDDVDERRCWRVIRGGLRRKVLCGVEG